MDNVRIKRKTVIIPAVAFLLISVFCLFLFSRPQNVESKNVNLTDLDVDWFSQELSGYVDVNSDSILNVREGPSTDHSSIAKLSFGTILQIHGAVTVDDVIWYYVSFPDGSARNYGFCSGLYVRLVSREDDPAFEELLDEQGFPESYRTYLRVIHALYPEWSFTAFQTGLTFDEVLQNEYKFNSNVIRSSAISSWKSLRQGSFDWDGDRFVGVSGDDWNCASFELIDYFIDPRNFLNYEQLFQFEQLTFSEDIASVESVDKLLAGTFMFETSIPEGDENGDPVTYAEALVELGRYYNVSPLMLAARVRQEQGVSGTNALISGTVPGYEGYYNYYNIEASGSTREQIIENGLNEAKREGWDSRYKALAGGIRKISQNYISKGQDTLYLQKFDVDGTYYGRYWHQYMQNIEAPCNESANVLRTYSNLGMLDHTFSFKIPVYDDMPSNACRCPLEDGNPNYRLSSLKVDNYVISPTFDSGTFTYTLTLPKQIDKVNISASAINVNTRINGTGAKNLREGSNEFLLETVSERGDSGTYKVVILKSDQEYPPETNTPVPTEVPTATPESTSSDPSETASSGATTVPSDPPTATPSPTPEPTPDVKITLPGAQNETIGKILYGIEEQYKASALLSKLTLINSRAEIKNSEGRVLSGDDVVSTGAVLNIYSTVDGSLLESYNVILFGDVTGDGKINSLDFVYIKRHVWRIRALEGPFLIAGSISSSDKSTASNTSSLDFVLIKRHVWNIKTIVQPQ